MDKKLENPVVSKICLELNYILGDFTKRLESLREFRSIPHACFELWAIDVLAKRASGICICAWIQLGSEENESNE